MVQADRVDRPRLTREMCMQFILMDYVKETGWTTLSREEQGEWLGAYRAYVEAMMSAGVLTSAKGLHPSSTATTVRVADGKTQVLDGPYTDSKEQLGGFRIIEVADLDAAITWAARCPTALHGVVEVRPIMDHSADPQIQRLLDTTRGCP